MSEIPAGQRLPYPGLRSFRRDETDLFFGRENSVNQMIRRLAGSRFLAVLGASGSGKSSLVRTGLLDGLELGLLAQAGSWWRVIDIRPGGEPLRNLARGLCGDGADAAEVEQMRAFLLRGPRSIAQWASTNLARDENLLLLVDQFEELFRYQHYEGRQEAEAFVALLIESARSRDQNIYVTLTMRSEFLGACALFGGLAEAMNDGQYLTPRMTREQCREAIEGPAAVCGFRIEPALVNRLLNDLSDFAPWDDRQGQGMSSQIDRMVRRADQLPLLQHALNRLWIKAASDGGDVVLKLADYDALGGLRGALNQHAREILDEVGPARAPVVEQVFRALTVGTNIADAVRRPTRLTDLLKITGASREDVVAVCDAFRAPGRNFLTPFPPTPLGDDTFIDISHESLIRQWSDLSSWLEKEARDADAMRRLGAASALAEAETGDLLRGRELANLESWRGEAKLPQAWAERYVNKPDAAFAFLDQSIQARKDHERAVVMAAAKERRRTQVRWGALAALSIAVLAGYSLLQRKQYSELQAAQAAIEEQRSIAEAAAAEQAKLAALAKEAQAKAEASAAEANRQAGIASESQKEANDAKYALDVQVQTTVVPYVAGVIDKRQRDNELAGSIDLLTALTRQFPLDKLPAQIVDRLSWQSAAQSASSGADTARIASYARPMSAIGNIYETESPYSLWRSRQGDESRIFVVERATLLVVDRFEVSTDDTDKLKPQGDYVISADGNAALLIGDNGRLFRWSAGQDKARRVLDQRWLKQTNAAQDRTVGSAAIDASTGDIALVYNQYGYDHLTVLHAENADQAISWPVHRFVAGNEVPISPAVIGIAEGKPLLAFSTNKGRQAVRVDLAAPAATHVAAAGRFVRSSPSPEPGRVRMEIAATIASCATGKVDAADAAGAGADLVACVADYDLRSGAFANPRLLPMVTADASELTTRGIMLLSDKPPVEPGDWSANGSLSGARITMVRPQAPSWALEAAATTPRPDIARVTEWRRKSSALDNEQQIVTRVSTSAGFRVFGISETIIQEEGTLGLDPGASTWGSAIEPRVKEIPSKGNPGSQPGSSVLLYLVDGLGTSIAGFSKGKLRYLDANGAWHDDVKPSGDPACLDLLSSAGTQAGGTRGIDAGSSSSAGVSDGALLEQLGYTAVASSATASEFLLLFRKGNAVARLRFEQGGKGVAARIECPANAVADSVAAIDFDKQRVALFNSQTGRVGVLSGQTFSPVGTLTNETLRFAAFAGDDLAIVTDRDRLLVGDAVGGGQLSAIANPLPGAEALYGNAGSLALVRTERAGQLSLSTAVLEYNGGENRRGRLTHIGFLPLGFSQISMAQLLDDGRIDVMTADNLFRFELPEVAPIDALVGSLQPLANEKALDVADESLLGLLASVMAVDGGSKGKAYSSIAYARCAEMLHRWQEGNADAESLTPDIADAGDGDGSEVTAACAPVDWPTPLAAMGLRSDSFINHTWPQHASVLLAQAVAGDSQALRSLLGWANRTTSDEVRGLGAEDALDRVNPVLEGPWSAAAKIPDFFDAASDSADPYAHLAIARAAEDDPARLETAVLHYALAERLLIDAGSAGLAGSANSRKLALANRLSALQRAAVTERIAAWIPKAPAVDKTAIATDLVTRVRADIDRLGQLSDGGADTVGFELLHLHLLLRLNDIAGDAEKAATRAEVAKLLLSRREWPAISLTDSNELVSAYREIADAVEPDDGALALRLRMAGLNAVEHAGESVDLDGKDEERGAGLAYQSMLRAVVAAGKDRVLAAADEFAFGKRAFAFSTVRTTDLALADWKLAVIDDRITLAGYLAPRPDAVAADATLRFWRAINRFDYNRSPDLRASDAERAELRDQLDKAFVTAYQALAKLPTTGPEASPDDMAVFVHSVVWGLNQGFAYQSDDQAFPPEFDQARGVADQLFALSEKGEWAAGWSRNPGETMLLLQNRLIGKAQLGPDDERNFGGLDVNAYRLRMRNIVLGASGQRIAIRGGVDKADDEQLAGIYSNAPAYAVAFVTGHEAGSARVGASSECDRLTAHEADPERRAPGRRYDKDKMAAAVAVCEAAVRANPADKTSQYQLARSLSDVAGREDDRLAILIELARSGYTIAYNNLTATGEDKSVDSKILRKLSDAYSNRIFRDHFEPAYRGLMALPAQLKDDAALRWMAERSAEAGSVEANVHLARAASEPAEKAYRLKAAVAAQPDLADDIAGPLEDEAETVMESLSEADRGLIDARLEAYRPGDLFTDVLTPETEKALRATVQ